MIPIDSSYCLYYDDTDPKYPFGKAVDASNGEQYDGTAILARWFNDIIGSRAALIKKAFGEDAEISGNPDNISDSDVLKAIEKLIKDSTDSEAEARDEAIENAIGELGEAKSRDVDEKITDTMSENLPTSKAVAEYINIVSDTARMEVLHCFVREKSWFFIRIDEENNVFLDYDEEINLQPPSIELDYENNKFIVSFDYPYNLDIVRDEKTGKTTMTLL